MDSARGLPVIDVGPLVSGRGDRRAVAGEIGAACREVGFFYAVGHGVGEALEDRLVAESRRFFALPLEAKREIAMERGGRAWRGWFPLGGELTSGQPDQKEGIYFGAELPESHPLVASGTPLHGRNLFPASLPGFREAVLDYMEAMTRLGHQLMAGISLSLGLADSHFAERYTADPLTLFRIFRYPQARGESAWGVGEHTDYGVLTILKQDDAGGLEVRARSGWLAAPPLPGSFVCNIGDMLDRMTRGLYRSTPHRVRNAAPRDRLSFPFFFDPGWNAVVEPLALAGPSPEDDRQVRWDRASVHEFRGSYGEYLLGKVSRVFPELGREVLP